MHMLLKYLRRPIHGDFLIMNLSLISEHGQPMASFTRVVGTVKTSFFNCMPVVLKSLCSLCSYTTFKPADSAKHLDSYGGRRGRFSAGS